MVWAPALKGVPMSIAINAISKTIFLFISELPSLRVGHNFFVAYSMMQFSAPLLFFSSWVPTILIRAKEKGDELFLLLLIVCKGSGKPEYQ